jgi:hypothetical protein
MTAACVQRPDWTGDAHRNDHRMAMVAEPVDQAVQNSLTPAGGMLRHLARPSPWLCGAQDDAVDPRAATEDLRGRLPGGRRSAYPAERAVQPLPRRLLLPDELEVLPCW